MDIKAPVERWFFEDYKADEKDLVIVGYDGVLKVTHSQSTRYQLHVLKDGQKISILDKNDLLMVVKASEFPIVKPKALWRKPVRELGLRPAVGLAKDLDIRRYVNPFIYKKKPLRKPLLVKVVLRSGLVVSCKLVSQDPWHIIGRCKVSNAKDNIAFVLIFKHAVYSVEENTEGAGV